MAAIIVILLIAWVGIIGLSLGFGLSTLMSEDGNGAVLAILFSIFCGIFNIIILLSFLEDSPGAPYVALAIIGLLIAIMGMAGGIVSAGKRSQPIQLNQNPEPQRRKPSPSKKGPVRRTQKRPSGRR